MKAFTATIEDKITCDRLDEARGSETVQAPPLPTLDSVAEAICLDANYDSLKFVLRSDTGHDGE